MSDFEEKLTELINKYSKETGSNTPDFILGQYLKACLDNFDFAVNSRARWYSDADKD